MKQAKELINFNAPVNLKKAFDTVCDERGFTRTYALVHIMHKFIVDMREEIERQHAEEDAILEMVQERRKMIGFKEFIKQKNEAENTSEVDMPVGFISNGDNDTKF